MTLVTKIIFRLYLPLVLLIAVVIIYSHSLNDYKYINAEGSTVKLQVSRHRRTITPTTVPLRYCKLNQYYDQEEGRCLGVPGGGKVLHVENGRSCGINILKPHCSSSLYYHICKHDKSILAQCANRQIFDSRLQRCTYYDSNQLTPSTIRPDDREYYEHVNISKSFSVPKCTRLGQFPVPDHCFLFYTCDTNGHRLHQSVFKCPRNTGYQANRGVCAVMSDCENNDSIDSTICVPDAPGENVESLNSKEATEENIEETTDLSKESETRRVNDFASKGEESINSKAYDISSSTSESITSNPLSVDNYGDKDDLYKANLLPTQSFQDISVSDGINETSTLDSALNPTESAREAHNEKDDSVSLLHVKIPSPPTVELDDNVLHFMMTPMTSTSVYDTDINFNIDNETANITPFSTINYMSSKLSERTQDITTEHYNDASTVILPISNTETFDSYSPTTISNTPEFSSINDKSLKIDEETQDVTEAVDSYQTSTISNVPESSPVIDLPSKLDEETQDITTEEYKNDDGTMILPISNTEAIDPYLTSTISNVPEFPSISKTSSKLYEETQSATTEQYENDDRIMTAPNYNTEIVNQNPTSILSDISVTTDNPSNNFDTSTLAPAILSPQADINDNQYAKELFKTSPSIDSKLVDPDLNIPETIENISTGYSPEPTDILDLASTTKSTLNLDHITALIDITTTAPTIQELPAISDTDLITQNGKDSTEASPVIEQDAPNYK
ncbi:uncharacterized protein [Anoplolepis gracilipes]|uniref:uncharacterized protein n=1 Tax=Anoplolepis gracilipes TaxID=354296 RepID=UPI003B9FC4C3